MPWVAAAGAVVGSLISSDATRSASNTQADAAKSAADAQLQQYKQTREDQTPYREAGYAALDQLKGMKSPTPEDLMATPGYQFGLNEGNRNVQGSAAARGGLYSGSALKALTRYGNDYATTKLADADTMFGNRWNRLAALAGIGQTSTQATSNAGAGAANAIGNINMSNANAQGAAAISQGNIWGNAVNQIASNGSRNNWWQGSGSGSPTNAQLEQQYGFGG